MYILICMYNNCIYRVRVHFVVNILHLPLGALEACNSYINRQSYENIDTILFYWCTKKIFCTNWIIYRGIAYSLNQNCLYVSSPTKDVSCAPVAEVLRIQESGLFSLHTGMLPFSIGWWTPAKFLCCHFVWKFCWWAEWKCNMMNFNIERQITQRKWLLDQNLFPRVNFDKPPTSNLI